MHMKKSVILTHTRTEKDNSLYMFYLKSNIRKPSDLNARQRRDKRCVKQTVTLTDAFPLFKVSRSREGGRTWNKVIQRSDAVM